MLAILKRLLVRYSEKNKVSIFNYPVEELKEDVENIKEAIDEKK